ncbi:ArsI/CadI family heavy metal resistance metalloenzyme [Gimesia panareensis]|uniref:Cadmium-induced protein CadI n=1 Tax=Gimesia panareensis TaxID=2527978 RepID=A0A517QB62_9PLAN|nr:ArsI/CadI family heavy metal resistance metalloenzyme [Gimesia panareensis]QDT28868.1 Cadmium-induced protein CadI [Gimesia panareensis]QDU51715.1 Cadmium-induced protein CadI [Gimesia panareensis]
MNQESAVDFPGNFRLHVALTVSDLARSKQFYELLLGVAPSKERPRYAKFEPVDPSVNLTLNEVDGDVTVEGGSAHFGIQVKSVAEVHAAIERFQAAGIKTITEEATTCCYAVQDKVWAVDPDGHKWEVFVVLKADAKDELYAQSGCCGPEMVNLTDCSKSKSD